MNAKNSLLLASLVLCAQLGLPREASAKTLPLRFSDTGTTAVWDRVSNKIHVPFVVQGEESIPLHIGSGADGPFSATTLNSFDVNSGTVTNTVTLDTSRTYHFTTFALPAGITLRGQGSAPLDIRVQGNVSVAGTIDLSGGNGGVAFTPRYHRNQWRHHLLRWRRGRLGSELLGHGGRRRNPVF